MLTSIVSVLLSLAAGQVSPPPPQEAPRFRSAVDLVSVAAVVRDRKGRFVTGLSRDDFEIVEAGALRPILDFRTEVNGPVKLAVVVDVSGSMRMGQRTADARQVARHMFANLDGADQAAVFTFDTALVPVQGFTSNRTELDAALASFEKPFGQTSLYDAIASVARVTAASGAAATGLPQRSAVVVITDGVDTRSRMTPGDVAMAASSIDVPIYIVAVAAGVDDPRETGQRRQAAVASDLQQLARSTGGELFITSAPAEASHAAQQMISELRHQYVLAFEASNRAGWRPLEVRARQSSLMVRARTGYSAGAPSSGTPLSEEDSFVVNRDHARPVHAGAFGTRRQS